MWFLQMDLLLLLLGGCAVAALALRLAARLGAARPAMQWMLLLDLAILWYVSKKLTVFYVGYVLVTFAFTRLLGRAGRGRKVLFALLCLGCCVPLLYWQAAESVVGLPTLGLVLVGFAYNLLKAIDALYYVYYAGETIDLPTYANYLLFFPVITAGPVFRYRDFLKTWRAPEPLTLPRLTTGVKRMIRGLFQKVVLSAALVKLLALLAGASPRWYWSAVIPLVSYCTLFFDMAGYADIAIGMGHIVGVTVPENFKKPWQAASFTQFWRNWHVTVSDWIREHVFVLVSGRALTRSQGALVAFLVMLLMSLWHDINWLFALDGLILGGLLAAENLLGLTTVNRRKCSKSYYVFRCVLTNYLFALNSLIFTLSTAQIRAVLAGFFAW